MLIHDPHFNRPVADLYQLADDCYLEMWACKVHGNNLVIFSFAEPRRYSFRVPSSLLPVLSNISNLVQLETYFTEALEQPERLFFYSLLTWVKSLEAY